MIAKYIKKYIVRIGCLFLWTIIIAGSFNATLIAQAEPDIGTYTATPIILSSTVKPHVLIIQDSSSSMLKFVYDDSYSSSSTYEGLFSKNANYAYNSAGYFYKISDTAGLTKGVTYWEGKFLNWLCTRRIDVAKSALTGGICSVMSGVTVIKGEPFDVYTPVGSATWDDSKDSDYDGSDKTYDFASDPDADVGDDFFKIGSAGTKYYIRVAVEAGAKPAGIIQELGLNVEFGVEKFDTSGDSNGGKILYYINTDEAADRTTIINDLVTKINGIKAIADSNTNGVGTPPAEAFCSAIGYFSDNDDNVDCGTHARPKKCGPRYHETDYNLDNDPYDGSAGSCIQSYVILITDGNANQDGRVTEAYIGSDFEGHYYDGSDDQLDNVAYWAHVNDLRSIDGKQNLTTYVIYTFGGDANAIPLLKATAKGGGFDTSKGATQPDAATNPFKANNWDKNADGVPDNYFEATSSSSLVTALRSALTSILGKSSSGTALSLLSTNTKAGESTAIQAYYRPIVSGTTLVWAGYLQSFWLDDRYNLREDSNENKRLDYKKDNIITFFVDANNDTKVHRIPVSGTSPYGDVSIQTTIDISGTSPLWDAGERLHQRLPAERKLFTVIGGTAGSFDTGTNAGSGDVKIFDATNAAVIKPYLGVTDDDKWSSLGNNADNRVTNLINWIRGNETPVIDSEPDMRSRALGGSIWKLGDIINSSPVAIGDPQQQYDVIYGDISYTAFRKFIKDNKRETVVYVGANDGMLHAFTSWRYNSGTTVFENPGGHSEQMGDELWAYIPQALLPHLKWLPDNGYPHVYYVDLTPVIMDVRIFEADPDEHPNGWGTILIGGFNWGGKHIQATGDFATGTVETKDFKPSYFCLDITNPRKPRVLWERTYNGLGLTTSSPSILRIANSTGENGNSWFAAFGSGPADYTDTTVTLNQSARIFVVDLLSGDPYRSGSNDWLKVSDSGKNGYMNSPVSFDKYLDYNVDSVYFGETYNNATNANPTWKGNIWKLSIPFDSGSPPQKEKNPTNWGFHKMLNFNAPITSSVSIGVGYHNTPYVFFGTGRYMDQKDKGYVAPQYLVGLVDHEDSISRDLLIDLTEVGSPYGGTIPANGWYYTLGGGGTGERSLTKPAVYAGAAIFTAFVPSSDICGFGGNGYLYLNDFFIGSLLTDDPIYLGIGNPSAPIIRAKSGGRRTHIDILGLPPGIGDNSGIVIAQSSTGAIQKIDDLPLPKIPRTKFIYWREP